MQIALLIIVILIWGKVAMDFFEYSDEKTTPAYQYTSKEKDTMTSVEEFSYELNLDYRDPFLGKEAASKSTPKKTTVSHPKPTARKEETTNKTPQVKWPKIDYLGDLASTKGSNYAVILRINGEESLISKGDSISGVSVNQLFQDSIQLSYMSELKTILK